MAKVPFFVSLTHISGDNIYCANFVCSYELSYKFAALCQKGVQKILINTMGLQIDLHAKLKEYFGFERESRSHY